MVISQNPSIPRPLQIENRAGNFPLTSQTGIFADHPNHANGQYLRKRLMAATEFSFSDRAKQGIHLKLRDDISGLGDEGHTLEVRADSVKIEALTPRGIFCGIQTLLQLLPPEIESRTFIPGIEWKIPCLNITDRPRFPWRGFMLDEGRHFHGKETVLQLLDVMASLKMNIFHWHLTEDQGLAHRN